MSRHRGIAWMLSAVLLLSFALGQVSAKTSEEIEEEIGQLEEDRAQLRKEREELEKLRRENVTQMEALVQQKNILDQQIALLYGEISNTETQIGAYGQLIADRQELLEEAEARFRELNEKYRLRIRAMEEAGRMSWWSVVFEANSFMDLLDRIDMIREIAAADRKRLDALQQAAEAVEAARQALMEKKSALKALRQLQEEAKQELEGKREEADGILRQLAACGAEYEAMLEANGKREEELAQQLAEAEQDLKEALKKEEVDRIPSVSEEGWMTPVSGYYISSPFGMRMHPILGYEKMHNGVDMACPAMTPIYASRSGVVTVADFQPGGAGNYVQLNHGDGYRSIYMHMTYYTVAPGQYVRQGQIIGYVGDSGLSKGNHLHFGISYKGTYVNPLAYI